ncbi:MAG: hypothetical protein H8D23_08250 [Candidatus Brocadiales bacterium]|nr:hypothetical protein [Candidatus Brocadiales bacterium]
MNLQETDYVPYIANILLISYADGKLTTSEEKAIEKICKQIKAKKSHLNEAKKLIEKRSYQVTKVGTFGIQVTNLQDMLYMSLVDGEIAENENNIINEFTSQCKITHDQLEMMVSEAEKLSLSNSESIICESCSTSVASDSKFCPQCGGAVNQRNSSSFQKISYEIPQSGYAIEFCESTGASFPEALKYAEKAELFDTCKRGKKHWYLASWSTSNFIDSSA